jgi:hypothetical protein
LNFLSRPIASGRAKLTREEGSRMPPTNGDGARLEKDPWSAGAMTARRSFWPSFFSRVVARLQWDPMAIDLAPDARAWPGLPAERRCRLTTLLAGFCVAEEAVSEHLAPFPEVARNSSMASAETLMAWVFFLQRRDEERHALLFDRIAAEVLGLPGFNPGRTARRGPSPHPTRGSGALRGAAARAGRRARGGPHRAGGGRRPLPHDPRGDRLRRRATRAARRPR